MRLLFDMDLHDYENYAPLIAEGKADMVAVGRAQLADPEWCLKAQTGREDEIRTYIGQCWAEARELYRAGKMPNYADQRYLELYREAQENALQDDWRVGAIQAFLDRKNPGELTCVREVCHRALSTNPDFPKEPSLAESKDIGMILNNLKDWERISGSRVVGVYGRQRCWQKKGEPDNRPDKPFWEED